jgi:anaerobic glycerol-3-phosphate dehydrogenase
MWHSFEHVVGSKGHGFHHRNVEWHRADVLADEGHLDEGVDGKQRCKRCATRAAQIAACGSLVGGAQVQGGAWRPGTDK